MQHKSLPRVRNVIVLSLAVAGVTAAALGATARVGPDLPDFGDMDGFAAVPLEPDEQPSSPGIPRPPREIPATQPTETAAPPAGEPDTRDAVTRALDTLKKPLVDRGVTPALNFTLDGGINLRGGQNTGAWRFNHLTEFNLTVATEPLFGWHGGRFFANFQNQNGRSTSQDVGAAEAVLDTEADGRTQLAEIWYEQLLFGDTLSLKLGKIDAMGEFAYGLNNNEFIGAARVNPFNALMPTYPDPAFGGVVMYRPNENLYAGAGVFDGSGQEGRKTGELGPATLFGSPGDLAFVGEAGFGWKDSGGRVGRLAVGGWHHTGTFDQFDGGTQDGATGGYVIFDQVLCREHPDDKDDAQGLGLTLLYGVADAHVMDVRHTAAATLQWTGPIEGRDDDVLGIGVAYLDLVQSAGFARDEWSVELFYRLQLTPWCAIKPDLQYILHPGGNADVDDALAATIRLEIGL